MKIVAVPRGETDRAVTCVFLRHVDTPGDGVRFADPIDAAAFRHRLTRLDDACAGGNAVARIDSAGATRAIGERKATRAEHDKACETSPDAVSPQLTHPYTVPDRKQPVYLAAVLAETVRQNGGKYLVPQQSGRSAGIANGPRPCKLVAGLVTSGARAGWCRFWDGSAHR